MGRIKRGLVQPWMIKLAEKHNIDPETVRDYHDSLKPIPHISIRTRTEEFFDLYFEGRNESGNLDR